MASVTELESVASQPRTLEAWLDGFDEDDRETVVGAILRGATADVFPIVSELDVNPYPFKRGTLNLHRRMLRGDV